MKVSGSEKRICLTSTGDSVSRTVGDKDMAMVALLVTFRLSFLPARSCTFHGAVGCFYSPGSIFPPNAAVLEAGVESMLGRNRVY